MIVSYPFNFTAGTSTGHEPEGAIVTASAFWDKPTWILRSKSDLPSRVAKIAVAVGAPKEGSPALLAWWLVERHLRSNMAPVAAYLVTANLLREAGLTDDAVRVLSEVAPYVPDVIAAELCRWGQPEEAKRVDQLKSRGRALGSP